MELLEVDDGLWSFMSSHETALRVIIYDNLRRNSIVWVIVS